MAAPRVLQVVLSLNPGGTESLVVQLAARLNGTMPMMVCCLDDAGAWAPRLQTQGIEVVALGRRPGFQPAVGQAIAKAVRHHRATMIHAHHYSSFVYSCLAKAWHPALPIVFTEHGRVSDAAPSAKRRVANRVLGRLPHRVFAVSEELKSHLNAEGFAKGAVDVIYNGIEVGPLPDTSLRARVRNELGVTGDGLVIGTIGRLDPVKDHAMLIQAVDQIDPDKQVLLIIIGDGTERERLEQAVSEMAFPSRVRLLGHREDARRWLAGCDIYVNSSISEGISLTILEAMAAGLAPVVTRVGGTPEVVDESCGRFVPPRAPNVLAETLGVLADDPALRHELGQRARQRVETRFTVERMVEQYRTVYESTILRRS